MTDQEKQEIEALEKKRNTLFDQLQELIKALESGNYQSLDRGTQKVVFKYHVLWQNINE